MRIASLTALIGLMLCAILLIGSPLTAPPDAPPRRAWPPLGLEWLLPTRLADYPGLFRPTIDLAGLGIAAMLAALAVNRTRGLWLILRNRPETTLLVATPACVLALHLFYVQLNDTYIVAIVPFAVLLLAVQHREWSPTPRLAPASVGVSLAALLLVSLWIRADFAPQTARWAAADRLTGVGVPAAAIYGWKLKHWLEYHGAFDEWLAAGKPGYEFRPSSRPGFDSFHEPFYRWLSVRGEHAAYRILESPMCEPGWRLIARDPYRTFTFEQREILTYQAVDPKEFQPKECDS
jgi:hypothetical protein